MYSREKPQRIHHIRNMKNEKPKGIDKKVVKIHDVLLDIFDSSQL